jgi:hypothetical protein
MTRESYLSRAGQGLWTAATLRLRAPVAQLDRASVYGTEGQRFESSRARFPRIESQAGFGPLPSAVERHLIRGWQRKWQPEGRRLDRRASPIEGDRVTRGGQGSWRGAATAWMAGIAFAFAMLCSAPPSFAARSHAGARVRGAGFSLSEAVRAFGTSVNQRFPHRTKSYWTCPRIQFTGSSVGCEAQFKVGDKWHHVTGFVTHSSGRTTVSYTSHRSWTRRWSRYSTRVISGFSTPGVAAVNSPYFDWAWLAAGLHDRWQRHQTRFKMSSYDGESTGLGAFYTFSCQASAELVRCANRFGDAIAYLPGGRPDASKPAKGWTPGHLWDAYGIRSIVGARGRGSTVAIVAAFKDTRLDHDLSVYRKRYGLPRCGERDGCLRVLNQDGKSKPLPKKSAASNWEALQRGFKTTWATEQSLDVEMVSTACPLCRIVVVQANSDALKDLLKAEDAAAAVKGVNVVSNSWGTGSELADEQSYATHFSHPGVVYVASAGDDGYGAQFPAAVPDVVAVGGTELALNGGTYSESVWDNASGATGSGCSLVLGAPAWQANIAASTGNPCNGMRMGNDVSAVADNVSVYDTADRNLPLPGFGAGWVPPISGTSVSAPIIAGLIGLGADGGRPVAPTDLYSAPPSVFHDITVGSNGGCDAAIMCVADAGYDGPSGLGSPNGIAAFAHTGTAAEP